MFFCFYNIFFRVNVIILLFSYIILFLHCFPLGFLHCVNVVTILGSLWSSLTHTNKSLSLSHIHICYSPSQTLVSVVFISRIPPSRSRKVWGFVVPTLH